MLRPFVPLRTTLPLLSALLGLGSLGAEVPLPIPLGFAQLSSFRIQEESLRRPGALLEAVPTEIRQLSDQQVTLQGYMLPLSLDGDRVRSFLLLPNTLACCFGQTPQINGWVAVEMTQPTPLALDVPLLVTGQFRVGEWTEDGQLLALYRLTARSVEVARTGTPLP